MSIYRFILEKYDRSKMNRYTCPGCGRKKEFTRYIDTMEIFFFPPNVGKCNRVNNCGYHYPPSQFFRDNPEVLKDLMSEDMRFDRNNLTITTKPHTVKTVHISSIDKNILHFSCAEKWYQYNNLFFFLCSKIGKKETIQIFKEYHVGTSKKWNRAATVFWQVSMSGEIRTGKIMLYHKGNGHRVKEDYSRIAWAHTEMNIKDFHLEQCFFGEHLLNLHPDKAVGIVESEKSAIISAAYMKDFIWIASGGINGCLNSRYHILRNRKICLFPDSKAYASWHTFYIKLKSENYSISISNLLEFKTNEEQWNAGIDIADILLQQSLQETTLTYFLQSNPCMQLLIDTFDLELCENETIE